MVKPKIDLIKAVNDHDNCPECNAKWKGEDIYQHFLAAKNDPNHEQHDYYKNKTETEILKTAGDYGWTPDNPKTFGHIIGIELAYDDPEHYDGVSYWMCPNCRIAWNRFDGLRTERFKKLETNVN